jgi:predicted MPP superfamily phosphohydrolase
MMKSFPSFVFGVATSAVSFGAHWVLLSWAERSLPVVAAKKRPLLLACAAIAVTPSLLRYLVLHTRSVLAGGMFAAVMVETMLVVFVAVPILGLIGLSEIVDASKRNARPTLSAPAAEPPASAEPVAAPMTRRGAIETLGGAAVVGATGLAFGWGMTVGRHGYRLREVQVRIPGLPRALDGYVIAQISDVHAGLFVGERELREGGEMIRRARPDMLVATGDLVDFDVRHAPALARALADIAPRDGVFAILGNHDYYAGHAAVTEAVRAAGITLLVNESRMIRPDDGGGFGLVGIDDQWAPRFGGPGPNLGAAMASLPEHAPRILLAHQPDAFESSAGRVALQLSGHTHGGQIRPANLFMRGPVAGRYDRDGSVLYVNSGFGVAGPPVRLGVPPEITRLVLLSA